jgi:hypothetical protein
VLFSSSAAQEQAGGMPVVPDQLVCTGCGRTGNAADVAAGWSLSSLPRATGRSERTAEEERVTALCPDCVRRSVRDVEARLDP